VGRHRQLGGWLRSSHPLKKVESARAEDLTGLKLCTEAAGAPFLRKRGAVAERSVSRRRCAVRHAGGIRSANADMSNDKGGEKPPRRKTKVSCATLIGAGLVDP
jgi:hypothetical protein